MKWFKHMSQSHTDEKLAELLSDCGLEGYGFWWLLMEVVAAQCCDDKCSATYSLPHWSRLLYSHHNRVGKYLGKLEVIGVVTLESIEGKLRVTIPNLLKYRDEYSKKSRQTTESVRSKKEKEKEKEKENIKETVSDSGESNHSKSEVVNEKFEQFWNAFAYKSGKAEALKTWNKIKPSVELADKIIEGAKREADIRPALYAAGGIPKMAQGWLSGRRWEDEQKLIPLNRAQQRTVHQEMESGSFVEDIMREAQYEVTR